MIQNIKRKVLYLTTSIALVATIIFPALTSAASLNQAGVRLGRLSVSASTNNDLFVTVKLNTSPTTITSIRVNFPTGFNVTAGAPTVSTSGFPATPSATALPGTLTAVATSSGANLGGDITVSGLTSASLNNTTLYGFIIPTGTITNPSTAGSHTMSIDSRAVAVTVDSSNVYTFITSGSNSDQITVNASVASNFSFSLSANSDTIPAVDSSSIQTSSGVDMSVSTNSSLGYTAYVKSGNSFLSSTSNPGTNITNGTFNGSPDTFVAGTTKYGFVPTTTTTGTGTGTITYDAEYAGLTGTTGGAYNGTSLASFVSRNGNTNSDVFSLKERVAVAPSVLPANDYTDTLTIVAAGNF